MLVFKYTDCVTQWAGEYVDYDATPSEIAEGTHSKCQLEFHDYTDSAEQNVLSITLTGSPNLTTIEKARSAASDVRVMTRSHIIRFIIETRGGK